MRKINFGLLLCWFGWLTPVLATVPSVNQCPEMIFVNSNENDSLPSNGSGGDFPGLQQRVVLGNQTYYIYVPTSYQANKPMPVMAVWHGTAGAGNATAAALDMRNFWQTEAEANHFIVVSQASTGASGGWNPGVDAQILFNIFADMEAAYNIETTRRYVWGFSGGGHVMHAIALNNADYFAAYAVSAGDLDQYAAPSGYTPQNASRVIPVFVSVGTVDFLYAGVLNDRPDFIAGGWVLDQDYWLDEFSGGHVLLNDLPEKAWNKICISTNMGEGL